MTSDVETSDFSPSAVRTVRAAEQSAARPTPEFLERTRAELVAVFGEARAIDIRHFEESTTEQIINGLGPRVIGLVRQALGLTAAILNAYEGTTAQTVDVGELNFGLAIDKAMARSGETKVADLAFTASGELRQALVRLLGHSPALSGWDMVCTCGSAVRRVQKSLCALEAALCEVEHLTPVLSDDSELKSSLQTRREYTKLRRFTATTPAPQTLAQVTAALRSAGTRCAILIGHHVYCRLRESDRYELRRLQKRILTWLGESASEARSGIRLWEDFAGFVEMLRQVNLRQELVQHDGLALATLEQALVSQGAAALIEHRALLATLDGLADDLDAALAATPVEPARVLAEVRRARERFREPTVALASPESF